MTVVLSHQVQEICSDLFPGKESASLLLLVEHELRRRLAEYQMMDHHFRVKYRMEFTSFQEKMIKEPDYSFEGESDFCDWEMAIDGIISMQKKIHILNTVGEIEP